MQPFYFGASSRPLFAVYHPPATPPGPRGGVLHCYPFGREYLRAHRAVRELANELGRRGFHGLRFDYYGCGDSGGEGEDGTIGEWVENAAEAREELSEASEGAELSAVGARLGGAIAVLAATRQEARPFRRLALWDPVVSGRRYLEELEAQQDEWARAHPGPADAPSASSATSTSPQAEGAGEILGFPLTATLREEIARIDLRTIERAPAESVLVMTSQSDPEADELSNVLERRGMRVERVTVPSPSFWLRQEGIDQAVVPTETIRSIAAWFANGSDGT